MRSPKGTIIRSIPDWNVSKLRSANFSGVAVAGGTYATVQLFNDATDGSLLVLWDAEVYADQSGATKAAFIRALWAQGAASGFSTAAAQLYFGQATSWGQLTAANPYANPHGEHASFPIQDNAWKWGHEWPLAVIPPGMSFGLVTDLNPIPVFGVSFIWEAVKQI